MKTELQRRGDVVVALTLTPDDDVDRYRLRLLAEEFDPAGDAVVAGLIIARAEPETQARLILRLLNVRGEQSARAIGRGLGLAPHVVRARLSDLARRRLVEKVGDQAFAKVDGHNKPVQIAEAMYAARPAEKSRRKQRRGDRHTAEPGANRSTNSNPPRGAR